MSNTIKLEIVTPTGTAYSADVEMVTLPAAEGDIGVFPRHVPMLTRIHPGEIFVRTAGGDHHGEQSSDDVLAVGEGLVAITGDHVAIVTDMAISAKDIDEAKVEEARQRALARLQDKISDEEVATVNASLARSLAQLRVKRRRR
jgi:F-type H+-transporting ATPase subunit epsilon